MSLINNLQSRIFKTQAFRGLLNKYSSQHNSLIITKKQFNKEIQKEVKKQKQEYESSISKKAEELVSLKLAELNIKPVETAQQLETKNQQLYDEKLEKQARIKEAHQYRVPTNFNDRMNPDWKPDSDVPFSMLRRMAKIYPIARACINRRIQQITQLQWEITTVNEIEDETGFESQIQQVKTFFKQPLGPRSKMRRFLTIIVDDLLTLDAVVFEKTKLRGGMFDMTRGIIPVDPTTICLLVEETGATPAPPNPAFKQIISGEEIAKFTTDEMSYNMMGHRSSSPYGLAPLESLIIQVESAIRGALYNLNYFKESNVPEGFVTLPESVASSKEQVEQWQMWFDMLVAGDPRFMRRLKILPGESTYTAAKKPEDMAFERFEMWLLQQTCAMFAVQPQDIGITYQVNKATGDTQKSIGDERGLYPLAGCIKEMFDDLIQYDMGAINLQFIFTNINPVDRKEEAEVAKTEIEMGALSPDEYRLEHGREPLGLGAHIQNNRVLVEDFINPKLRQQNHEAAIASKLNPKAPGDNEDPEDKDKKKMMLEDIRKWKRCVYKDFDEGRDIRLDFESNNIPSDIHSMIRTQLQDIHSKQAAKVLFDQFLDPQYSASLELLKMAEKMRRIENAQFVAE